VNQCNLVKQVMAHLAKLDGTTSKGTGSSKKSTKKPNEIATAASQADPFLRAEYVSDIKQAQDATKKANAKGEQAAGDMFQIYANLPLSINPKYTWNKIVQEQTASDPYTDLQGCSKKGLRGFLCKSFVECMMFNLLSMFPNNAAEQERCCIMNMLKKPLRISMHQFMQCVEQLNSYIAQLPCW
jgi:hypothetical protein